MEHLSTQQVVTLEKQFEAGKNYLQHMPIVLGAGAPQNSAWARAWVAGNVGRLLAADPHFQSPEQQAAAQNWLSHRLNQVPGLAATDMAMDSHKAGQTRALAKEADKGNFAVGWSIGKQTPGNSHEGAINLATRLFGTDGSAVPAEVVEGPRAGVPISHGLAQWKPAHDVYQTMVDSLNGKPPGQNMKDFIGDLAHPRIKP